MEFLRRYDNPVMQERQQDLTSLAAEKQRRLDTLAKGSTLLEGLMHFVQMVLNFDKMSRQINHDLQNADGV